MTYSYLTTQNLYILHPYRRKSIRKDISDLRLRIQCYGSLVTEKDDLPFQLTYHAFFLPSTFRQRMRKDEYTDFSTTYLSVQLPRKTDHFKSNQRIQMYTQNTLHRRKIEMMKAPLLVQQFTHPVHPNSSYRFSYLLRQFVDKTGKIRNRQQTKHKGKTSKTVHTAGKHLFSRKVTMPI